jgi:hypothetical protein
MEISLCLSPSIKNMLNDDEDPMATWTLLKKRFGAKQQGLQSMLLTKVQLAKWDGTGTIMGHRDYMVDIRTQLKGASLPLLDQTFYGYFVNSLPHSCALFTTLYDDMTYDVERLCDRFAAYEMCCKLADMTEGMAGSSSGSALALSSQQTLSKGKGKERQRQRKDRDLTDVTCYSCGGKGHLHRNCPTDQKKDGKSELKPADRQDQKRPDKQQRGGAKSAKDDAAKDKAPLGTLYMVTLADAPEPFYMDSAASYHLVPSRECLHDYQEFAKPIKVTSASGHSIYAHGMGILRVVTSATGIHERQASIHDVYYALDVHAQLVSLRKLQRQGWEIRLWDGQMELWNVAGLFAEVIQVNDVFPAKFEIIPPDAVVAAWTTNGDMDKTTHDELVGHLENVAMVATARGPDGAKASLLTWHRRLGHPMCKMVMALACDGASRMVITDLPVKVPGLDGCAACIVAKSVHLPHKEGRG